ncbi:sll0787 family AIR synthase-like protein [Uliginosibacterium sp. H3]|uniref:Sll0787 family AIR synthase-like protein n=1 Tax=Uliginosibacterium silvisoli TaxID=3114758 RepID=A0ABU6K2B3_9RHOO|nr:sll0787 family AIR synthase-like protein [Uliginosibacterium sp. H3]
MSLKAITTALRESRGFAHKRDISDVVGALSASLPGGFNDMSQAVAVGDDCAAIPDGDGYLLFAIEGMTEDFIAKMPWFAGYSGVMVNISDIAAMGGRPIAVVDALWSKGMHPADEVIKGMAAASAAYGVPIVGGHSNNRSERGQLAVAILGRAKKLLTSFNARPGDKLMMAIDLRGQFEEPYPWWNASSRTDGARLRGDLELLPMLAENGLCDAAKDISMAGAVGTAMMLLECSGVGAVIDFDAIPRPEGVDLQRWLTAFPSFGFVLSVRPENVGAVQELFAARNIACACVGDVKAGSQVVLQQGNETEVLWDFSQDAFITPSVREMKSV